jgi:hypothetical protein
VREAWFLADRDRDYAVGRDELLAAAATSADPTQVRTAPT